MVDQEYYRRRAEQEFDAAERASDPAISQIHREMARRYRDLAGDGSVGAPVQEGQQVALG